MLTLEHQQPRGQSGQTELKQSSEIKTFTKEGCADVWTSHITQSYDADKNPTVFNIFSAPYYIFFCNIFHIILHYSPYYSSQYFRFFSVQYLFFSAPYFLFFIHSITFFLHHIFYFFYTIFHIFSTPYFLFCLHNITFFLHYIPFYSSQYFQIIFSAQFHIFPATDPLYVLSFCCLSVFMLFYLLRPPLCLHCFNIPALTQAACSSFVRLCWRRMLQAKCSPALWVTESKKAQQRRGFSVFSAFCESERVGTMQERRRLAGWAVRAAYPW